MMVVNCQTRGHRVLLGLESIVGIHNTELGPVVEFNCCCDVAGLWLRGSSFPLPDGVDPAVDGAVAEIVQQRALVADGRTSS